MDFTPPTSSPPSSPPRSSSPTNSSGGSSGRTLVELTTGDFVDFPKDKTKLSPNSMTSVLSGSDPMGSPRPLSPLDDVPMAPDGKESLFFRPPSTPPGTSHRGQKYQPYHLHPAPLELRFAARVMGRIRQPEFTPEEIEENEELAERGLSQLSLTTLYKAFKAKLASCKTACQCLLTMAWELEEMERQGSFLQALHADNKQLLGLEDAKLERMGTWFSLCNLTEVEDDTNYFQAVYDDECEIL
ncbi:hypothetical protein EDB19DRAFT_1914459 [Suillus lakei]|nr:hypothetical protein EDB19DRAFT_1914459 [Suillus lakei]